MTAHLFLISSPLQVIVAENIKRQYLSLDNGKYYAFCEGDRLADLFNLSQWTEVIRGKNTRPSIENAKKNIRHNLEIIESYFSDFNGRVILYVSELFWMFNNVIFRFLKKKYGSKLECAFIDEGLVMYRSAALSGREKLSLFVKYLWLKLAKFPAELVLNNFPVDDTRVDRIYAYHPYLMSGNYGLNVGNKKIFPLNPGILIPPRIFEEEIFNSRSVLFLSQPYYRVIPQSIYEALIADMVNYFYEKGYTELLIKPHDADLPEWIEYLTNRFNFKIFEQGKSNPIESFASQLRCGAIVSVCSSALLNLKLFGYQGEVISYGIKRCNLSAKLARAQDDALKLYAQIGVTIID